MSGPAYPNQQLRAVALEAYFKGRIGFRSAATRVQQRFEAQLPNLFVPNAQANQAIDLQPYQLRDDGPKESLAIAVNQVAYVSFAYPGHETFIRRALELMEPTLSELEVSRLERVIYRYENELAIGRDEHGVLPIGSVLRLPGSPWWEGSELTEIASSWTQLAPRGRLGVNVRVEGDARTAEKLLISVVSMVNPAGPVTDLARYATDAHEAARAWFEGAITDEFRRYIKGDGDE